MNYRNSTYRLFLTLLSLYLINNTGGVIVDGEKKKDMLATKNQSDEKSMIDAFNTKTCGIADPNFNEHEFVSMAREGQFPWMVSFQIKIPYNTTRVGIERVVKKEKKNIHEKMMDLHFCCGSFISDKWILSAAHCFEPETIKTYLKTNKLKVVAGSHKVSSRSRINRNLTIERIYYHSQFDKNLPIGFDIALIELKHKVKFSQKRVKSELNEQSEPFMNTICLPLKGKKYNFNETARIAGWGLSNEKDESSMPSKLLMTDILLSKKDECIRKYVKSLKSDRPKYQQEKYDDFICASYKDTRDACQSDSGGPLMQFANGKAVAIGIVSYGIGCAKKRVPGLYTRTSAYINWIKDITMNGKDSSVEFKLFERGSVGSGKTSNRHDSVRYSTTQRPIHSRPSRTHHERERSTSWTKTPRNPSVGTSKRKSKEFRFFDE